MVDPLRVAARFTKARIPLRVAARFTQAASLPSAHVLAFLKKVTKGTKGGINLAIAEESFKLFGSGWSVTDGIGALPLTHSSHIQFVLKSFCAKYDCKVWGYTGTKEPKEFWFDTQEKAELALPALKAEVQRCGPKGPTDPQRETLYIAKIRDEVTQDFAGRWTLQVLGAWYGRPSFEVKTPAGSMSFVLDFNTKPTDLTSDRFWKLLYQSGAKEMAQKILGEFGDEAVDRVLRPSQFRDLANTGTCPVCFGNFKLTPSTRRGSDKTMPGMILHGYKRPGLGYIQGNCFGQDWPPFELSREGTDAYIKMLESAQEQLEDSLKRHQSGEVVRLQDDSSRVTRFVKRDEVEPRVWDRLLERAILGLEHQLRGIEVELSHLKKTVQGWKPAPLPS